MIFADVAMAQTTTPAAAGAGGLQGFLQGQGSSIFFLIAMFMLFYFLMIRPQQRRVKQHQMMISALKRGDQVVLNSGVVGKVTRVDDAEATVEIAPTVNIKVVKAMISEVRTRGEPAPANDAKS